MRDYRCLILFSFLSLARCWQAPLEDTVFFGVCSIFLMLCCCSVEFSHIFISIAHIAVKRARVKKFYACDAQFLISYMYTRIITHVIIMLEWVDGIFTILLTLNKTKLTPSSPPTMAQYQKVFSKDSLAAILIARMWKRAKYIVRLNEWVNKCL